MSGQISRRNLGKVAFGGALGAAVPGWPEFGSAVVSPEPPGIHLASQAPVLPTDEDLQYFKQLGLDTVYVRGLKPEDQTTVEDLKAIKKRYADAGLAVCDIGIPSHNGDLGDIVLNLPGRNKAIESYKSWIRLLGQAGFQAMEALMFNPTGSVQGGRAPTRGGPTRWNFDANSSELGGAPWHMHGKKGSINDLLFGREYSNDEIWENYRYFIKQVTPVAEEAGIRIPFDLDDPPLPTIFGVPRIFSTFENCKKAMKIANSPNVGLCIACGQWLEGGAAMGIDAPGAIRYFASQKQIFMVYCRNSSSTLPHFHETYIDDGYYDLYKIMKALTDVKYNGVVTLDHWMDEMVGGRRSYDAFGIGYLRAMLQCAQRGYRA